MIYRIYLYKTVAVCADAPAIGIIERAVAENSILDWYDNDAANCMLDFDTAAVKAQICREFRDPETGLCKCWVQEPHSPAPGKAVGYLRVSTDYENAAAVLPRLLAISNENGLVMYDAEKRRSYFPDVCDIPFITAKLRHKAILDDIQSNMYPYQQIRRLEFRRDKLNVQASYVVTLKKDSRMPLIQRVEQFHDLLKAKLAAGEELICENRCFSIVGEGYTLTYCLEAYGKHSDQVGYFENGAAHVDLLRHMGCEQAFFYKKSCESWEPLDIDHRMDFWEMRNAYPNPAERFVASVKITKWQRRQKFDIRYSNFGYYGSEILFHMLPSEFDDDARSVSVLKIEEESASFLLPFLEDVYPYIYTRYYDENHIPPEMWADFLARLEAARKMICEDTFDPALSKYIEKFNLFVLSDGPADDAEIRSAPVRFLYKHRYEVATLFDAFIQWAEAQPPFNRLYNIAGP